MIRSRSKEPPNDKPAPTPLSELNRLAERQRKYHPARPYRWWEYKPMQAEPPEVFYPPREGLVDYTSRCVRAGARTTEEDFWPTVVAGLFLAGLWLLGEQEKFWAHEAKLRRGRNYIAVAAWRRVSRPRSSPRW